MIANTKTLEAEILTPAAREASIEAAHEAYETACETLAEAKARHDAACEELRFAIWAARKTGKHFPRPAMASLDAAFKILQGYGAGVALDDRRLVKEMGEAGLWMPTTGITPWVTLRVGIEREIAAKREAARFARGKTPGTFMINPRLEKNG
jgi:hypothetical protein